MEQLEQKVGQLEMEIHRLRTPSMLESLPFESQLPFSIFESIEQIIEGYMSDLLNQVTASFSPLLFHDTPFFFDEGSSTPPIPYPLSGQRTESLFDLLLKEEMEE
jgi:hypothetical protein